MENERNFTRDEIKDAILLERDETLNYARKRSPIKKYLIRTGLFLAGVTAGFVGRELLYRAGLELADKPVPIVDNILNYFGM